MVVKIILLIIGIFASFLTIYFTTVFPFFAPAPGLVAGYCFLRLVVFPMSEKITTGIFAPSRKNAKAPFLFDRITSLIAKQEYETAISELEEILRKEPGSSTATSIAATLYAKKINAPEKAVSCIQKYLSSKSTRSNDDADILLLFSDICVAGNMVQLARKTLELEIQKNYSVPNKRSLNMRLEYLKNISET